MNLSPWTNFLDLCCQIQEEQIVDMSDVTVNPAANSIDVTNAQSVDFVSRQRLLYYITSVCQFRILLAIKSL